jgi:hypothetical protein
MSDSPARDEDWPRRPQLWLFAQPYWVAERPSMVERSEAFELGMACVLDGLWVLPELPIEGGDARKALLVGLVFSPIQVPHGELLSTPRLRFLPPLWPNNGLYWPLSDVAAACRFLQLPIVGREVQRLPRQQRRQLERAGKPPGDVQVTDLNGLSCKAFKAAT